MKLVDCSLFASPKTSMDDLVNLAHIYSYRIDFRSFFPAAHSARVAKVAEKLA